MTTVVMIVVAVLVLTRLGGRLTGVLARLLLLVGALGLFTHTSGAWLLLAVGAGLWALTRWTTWIVWLLERSPFPETLPQRRRGRSLRSRRL